MDNYPIVVENFFSEATHDGIKKFVNEIVPLLPTEVDEKDFIREYIHNVPFFVDIHHQLTDFASECFGEQVKPSYCFLSMYKEGGMCPLHIDRPQCRYTIDYLIQTTQSEQWPIKISDILSQEQLDSILEKKLSHPETDEIINMIINHNTWSTINLTENQAVLYSGTHSWHYRPETLVKTSDLVFFHFVPKDFDGPLH